MLSLGGLDGDGGGGLRELHIETCCQKFDGMSRKEWRDPDFPTSHQVRIQMGSYFLTSHQVRMGSLVAPEPQVETRHSGESGDSAQGEARLCW